LTPTVAIWVRVNALTPGSLTLRAERHSAQISTITNDDLTRSGTGCFIAVPLIPYGNSGRQRVKTFLCICCKLCLVILLFWGWVLLNHSNHSTVCWVHMIAAVLRNAFVEIKLGFCRVNIVVHVVMTSKPQTNCISHRCAVTSSISWPGHVFSVSVYLRL